MQSFPATTSFIPSEALSMAKTTFVTPAPIRCEAATLSRRSIRVGRHATRYSRARRNVAVQCVQELGRQDAEVPTKLLTRTAPYQVRDWIFKSFTVQYAVAGEEGQDFHLKPALILVHGFGANCQHWRNNINSLADNGWRVYAMDLLGFGMGDKPTPGTLDSDGNPVMYTFDYWTFQLNEFIRDIVKLKNGQRVFFVANSIGSMVTMQAAVQHPEICAGQVFISPSLRQLNVRKRSWVQDITAPFLIKILSYRPLGAYFLNSLARPDQLRRVLAEAYEVKEAVDEELVNILGKPANTEGALDVFLAFIMYDDGPIPEDFLPVLSQPSMIIWGEEDRFEPIELGEALRHYSIVDQFVSLPDVGHCAHDELPDECNKLISEFVQTNIDRVGMPSG